MVATHPLRATAVVELRPEGNGTIIRQTNRYQVGTVAAMAGRALGLEKRLTTFWRGFHRALQAETEREAHARTDPRGDRTRD